MSYAEYQLMTHRNCNDDCEDCCHEDSCACPDDREDDDVSWFDDDGDADFLFEQARDRRYFR